MCKGTARVARPFLYIDCAYVLLRYECVYLSCVYFNAFFFILILMYIYIYTLVLIIYSDIICLLIDLLIWIGSHLCLCT